MISCPADLFYVAINLNHALFISCPKGSIITAFYEIIWGHHVMGFNSPTDNPFVQPLKVASGYAKQKPLKKNP